MYDVTHQQSYLNISNWSNTIDQNCDATVIKLLVANKIDVPPEKRIVSTDMGQEMANKYKMKYFETSAKTGEGVTEAFMDIANTYV